MYEREYSKYSSFSQIRIGLLSLLSVLFFCVFVCCFLLVFVLIIHKILIFHLLLLLSLYLRGKNLFNYFFRANCTVSRLLFLFLSLSLQISILITYYVERQAVVRFFLLLYGSIKFSLFFSSFFFTKKIFVLISREICFSHFFV